MSAPNTLHRLFIPNSEINKGDTIQLNPEAHNYIKNVLRLSKSDKLQVFNNSNHVFTAEITNSTKSNTEIAILDMKKAEGEPSSYIVLLQGIPKADKLEWIIQKTTELGVSEIIPINSSHSIKKISSDKLPRFSKIASEASKQSKRSKIPLISDPIKASTYLNQTPQSDSDLKILFSQEGTISLKSALKEYKGGRIFLAVGPEGDFSDDEKKAFIDNNFLNCSLGPRVLRSETAAILVTGITNYETGNLEFFEE